MTNLTSEQYRSILKHIPGCTTEIPTVQTLLRRCVQLFYKRFGAYPEVAGVAPGNIGIFGDQTQFTDGIAIPTATPMVTIIVGRRVPGSRFTVVTSADVGKPHKVKFSFSNNRPLGPGCPSWLNYVKGVIDKYPDSVPPFEAAIESSVPMGVGFGSTSALEVAVYSFIEVIVGNKASELDIVDSLQKAEKEFVGKEIGLVSRIGTILAKDRHATIIDCKTNEVTWLPLCNSKTTIIAVNSHLKDELIGDEYSENTKHIRKACEILNVENLRDCTEEDVLVLETKVNEILEKEAAEEKEELEEKEEGNQSETEIWTKEDYDIMIKRARFFITEMIRIKEAITAWEEGNIEVFGEKMKESHKSLKEDFDFNNPVLDFLVDTSLEVEGVLGSKMTGMGLGFGGGIISLVNKENVDKYCNYITEKFVEHESKLAEDMKVSRQQAKQRQFEIKKKFHSKHFNPTIASSEKIGLIQELLEAGEALKKIPRRISVDSEKRNSIAGNTCMEKKKTPCIVKVEKPPGGCGTWAHFQKDRDKSEFLRKLSQMEEELKQIDEMIVEGQAKASEASTVVLTNPSFYIISPFAGARMMFVTKADILRSRYSQPVPHPKALVRTAIKEFETTYGSKIEAVGLAPTTITLFGDFMEFHLGYIISLTLPMYVVTVGGRNDTVFFSVKTTSEKTETPHVMKCPVPSVRQLEIDSRNWVNYVMGVVNEFKSHVPGFNAVVHSSAPAQIGLRTCAALQSSIYTFLENLTRECTDDLFEKINRCTKSEIEFQPAPTELITRCSSIKFLPIFLCKEGHLILINCKNYKVAHYYFDDPAYAFLIANCKRNNTTITLESLDERLKQCMEAIELLDKKSLLFLDQKHLKCLKKRDASDEVIKRAKYVITEHQITVEAIKALKDEDYSRVGLLMNRSHASLRDDYEVSSPEIEALIELALSCEGVLGAKMLGTGLNATIIILIKLSDADKCIRYMRKNYKDKSDKPVFYITKPAGGAFMMNPTVDVPYIL